MTLHFKVKNIRQFEASRRFLSLKRKDLKSTIDDAQHNVFAFIASPVLVPLQSRFKDLKY